MSHVDSPPVLDRLVRALAQRPSVREVWLFGSRARGDARERSDIDLAVDASGASEREWIDIWTLVDEAPTLLPIDLVRLDRAPEELRASILKDGRRLYPRRGEA